MRDINRAERLLSLFTSPDSAAGIVGDLSEERGQRGSVWFWRQVLGTAFSLGRGALFEAPVVVLALLALGFLLLVVSIIVGSVATGLTVQLLNPRVPLQLALAALLGGPVQVALWWYGAALTGAWLMKASPQRGMLACMLLFCAVELLLLYFSFNLPVRAPRSVLWVVLIIGLVVPVSLLRSGTKVRRRQMGQLA